MKTTSRKRIHSSATAEHGHVYKLIELTGTSKTSIEDAINTALRRASASIRNLRWFQVTEIRGDVDRNQASHWQITLKAGFTVEA